MIFFSEPSLIFGDTASIQYIHGKIIIPKNWSMEKVNQLKAKLDNGNKQNYSLSIRNAVNWLILNIWFWTEIFFRKIYLYNDFFENFLNISFLLYHLK